MEVIYKVIKKLYKLETTYPYYSVKKIKIGLNEMRVNDCDKRM